MAGATSSGLKAPTVVRYNGGWHPFYTAQGRNAYTLGYVAATSLQDLQKSSRIHSSSCAATTVATRPLRRCSIFVRSENGS